jgi:hypothetical protein
VVWQGDSFVHGAEWGSAILPSVVHASPVGRAYVRRQGRRLLGLSECCGSGAAGGGSCGPMDRLGLCDFGHIDSRHSRVACGEGFG